MIKDDLSSHRGGVLKRISFHLGVNDEDWEKIRDFIPTYYEDYWALLFCLLKKSGKSPTILLCMEDVVVLRYDETMSFHACSLCERQTGKRIQGDNEVIDGSVSLSTDALRLIFVMLEALVFKCVHLKLEGQSQEYNQRSENYEARLSRLEAAGLITNNNLEIAQELYQARCQFAHSLKSIEDITYKSVALKHRWGGRGRVQTRKLKRYFLSDAFLFSEELLGVFKPVQFDQIDETKFKTELLGMLAN